MNVNMKNCITIICTFFVVNCFGQQLVKPIVSLTSGYYTVDQTVSVSHTEPGVTIFYTTNGSEPTPNSNVYTGPIIVGSRIGEANNHSMIPTNPSFNYPIGDYTASRANNRGWVPPYNEVFKVNILRFKAYKAGFVPSETATRTVIVDPSGSGLYEMPVLSLVVDSIDLFSGASGIYVYGDHPEGNYTQKGSAWERIAAFDYFDEQGNQVIDNEVRIRIHGGGSRHSAKKTFRVYAEHNSVNNFDYKFFDNHEVKKFKRILIRSGGHRPDCFPRDNLGNYFAEGLNVDHQHYKHIILFINGEFWGIHAIKERVDKYFIQNQFGIDDNDVTILDQEYDIQDGHAADSLEMVKIEAMADTSDMTLAENYKYVTDRIDVENYIDYMSTEIFLSNVDWVYSNVVIWRKTGPYDPSKGPGQDGKFRWVLYDLDGAFGGSCDNAYYTVNTLEDATVETGLYAPYSRLFRGLLGNEDFRRDFINRSCDLMNSHFRSNVLKEKLEVMYNQITPEMQGNVERWRYPSIADNLADRAVETPSLIQWDTTFYYLRRFADNRQRKFREHIMDKWSFPDTSRITIDVNDVSMGSVQINSILINNQLPGVEASVYPWTGMYIDSVESQLIAVPMPGYEFVEWLETGETNDTISWLPDGDTLYTAIFQLSSDYSPVVINEVMPSNSNYLEDNFGEHDDWLELYNPNPYPVNLSNWYLQQDLDAWIIPNGTVIEGNGYLLFWHDNEQYQGADHTSFKLTNDNNKIVYLFDPAGGLVDNITYPETTTDYSYGRYPNGSGTFATFESPTPRMNNDASTIKENSLKQATLTVYPNPTTGWIQLSKQCDFKLYSIDGKQLLNVKQKKSVDLSSLENGTYLLLTSEGESCKIILRK